MPTASDQDEPLLDRLRSGDPIAFEELVRSQGGRLLLVARRILGNEDDAREAVQDGFLAAFRAIASFEGGSRIGTWLHRIVVNACLGQLRRRGHRATRSIDDLLPRFHDDGHQLDPAVEWREPGEVALQRAETCSLVRRTIDELPEIYRTMLILRDIEGMDIAETARLLGVTEAVVKTRTHRARQALRTLLDPYFRGGAL